MKKFFKDDVLVASAALLACSVAIGLAYVYAIDKLI